MRDPTGITSLDTRKSFLLLLQEEEHMEDTRKRTTHMARMRKQWTSIIRNDYSKDSERLRILISMTIWAIWKSRNKNSINDQDVAPSETREH
jgi:hypothetical protein